MFILICLYWPCKAPLGEWLVNIIVVIFIIIIVIITIIISSSSSIIITIIIIIIIIIIIVINIVLTNVTFVVNIRKHFNLQGTAARKHR